MRLKRMLTVGITSAMMLGVNAQQNENFTFTPAQPKPGDLISFSYLQGGDLTGQIALPQLVVNQLGSTGTKVYEIKLTRNKGRLVGEVQTDTSAQFLYFGFSIDEAYDNNNQNGFTIDMFEGDKPRFGANRNKANFYQYFLSDVGGEASKEKAVAALKKEIELYQPRKKEIYPAYLRLIASDDKAEGQKLALTEIEAALKDSLKTESDYQYVQSLYTTAGFPQQARVFTELRKTKFPDGSWKISDKINAYAAEKDLVKKEAAFKEILEQIETNPDWKTYASNKTYFAQLLANAYLTDKKENDFSRIITTYFDAEKDKSSINSLYYSAANRLQNDSTQLPTAEKYAALAYNYANEEVKNGTTPKPDSYTSKQWESSKKNNLSYYGNLYAQILHKQGKSKKALPIIKETALVLGEGKNETFNATYASIAGKTTNAKALTKQLEQFVKNGAANANVKDQLKAIYVKSKKSEGGFDTYLKNLEREGYLKLIDNLKKSILNKEDAALFSVQNIQGETVDLNALKGKVVILDFWATWCGPCIASFPNMQKAVTQYEKDNDVVFLFVNSWENGDDKKKSAADFIEKNKYTFNVPLDLDDKVIGSYGVTGIPTKFIINKEGKITFKKIGGGPSDKLLDELLAMIELAKDPTRSF